MHIHTCTHSILNELAETSYKTEKTSINKLVELEEEEKIRAEERRRASEREKRKAGKACKFHTNSFDHARKPNPNPKPDHFISPWPYEHARAHSTVNVYMMFSSLYQSEFCNIVDFKIPAR